MSIRFYANAPATALASSCSNSQTTVTVSSATGYPIQFPFTIIVDRGTATEEAMSVTAAAGAVFTVTRAIDSTTAFAHSLGAVVEHGVTAQDIREPNAHINASTAVHGIAGAVVGTTDVQAVSNKDLTSGTNTFPTSLVTLVGAQALTNKTIGTTNTINGFTASRFMEADGTGKLVSGTKVIPAGAVVGTTDAQALTTKTIDLASNTVTGTTAQFNTALSDNDFATLAGVETLTNKTLTTPTLNSPTITGVGVKGFVAKGADQNVTSSAVLTPDLALTFAVPAAGTYLVDLTLQALGAAAGDMRIGATFTGTCTVFVDALDVTVAATNGTVSRQVAALTSGVDPGLGIGVNPTGTLARLRFVLVASGAGTFTFLWAQSVANATSTTVKAGSVLQWERVA